MKFDNVINIVEAISKQNLENANFKEYEFIKNNLMAYLRQKKDVIVNIDLTKIDSAHYIAKKYNREDLYKTIEDATMSKDFDIRNKNQKKLKQEMVPLYKQLINDLYKEVKGRSITIKKNVKGDFIAEFRNTNNIDLPYIKFQSDKKNKKWYLISYHNYDYTFKKKSYNDNVSYKLGDNKTKKEIKDKLRG